MMLLSLEVFVNGLLFVSCLTRLVVAARGLGGVDSPRGHRGARAPRGLARACSAGRHHGHSSASAN